MKAAAINIKTFSDAYIDLYLPTLLDPKQSREIKLSLIATIQKQTQDYLKTSSDMTDALTAYKTKMLNFKNDMTNTATEINKQLQKDLKDIQFKIDTAKLELQKYQAQLTAAGVGLGASVFVGAVGIWAALAFGGPLGPFIAVGIAVVCLIGAAISIGYMIDAGIKINQKENEISDLIDKQNALLEKEKKIKEMLEKVEQTNVSINETASYAEGFKDLWKYINNQLKFINEAIVQWDGTVKDQPAFVDIFLPRFADQLKPYFENISSVMEAYIVNFP